VRFARLAQQYMNHHRAYALSAFSTIFLIDSMRAPVVVSTHSPFRYTCEHEWEPSGNTRS